MNSCSPNVIEISDDEQFIKVYYKNEMNDVLNTEEKTYQKNLILDGYIKTKMLFTKEEQTKVLEKAEKINFFLLPDDLSVKVDTTCISGVESQFGKQIIQIAFGQKFKKVIFVECSKLLYPEYSNLFNELLSIIITTIKNKPEYKALPPRRGGIF